MTENFFKFKFPYFILIGILLLFGLSGCALTSELSSPELLTQWQNQLERGYLLSAEPNPNLTPEQVVRIQLGALRNNDSQDRGIAVTFKFASPANKRFTGPLQRFAFMIKSSYGLLLNYERAEYEPVEVVEGQALQRVKLFDRRGNAAVYLFQLSKQTEGECLDCWMTDAVFLEEIIPMTQESA